MVKPGQLYTKNGKDFRVHEVTNGKVFGCLYNSENRGQLDPELHWYQLMKVDEEGFVENTGGELVPEVSAV